MNTLCIPTRRGPLAWLARKFELLNVSATLHWAERDREYLAQQLDRGPRRLKQMDLDLGALRVRQAALRKP